MNFDKRMGYDFTSWLSSNTERAKISFYVPVNVKDRLDKDTYHFDGYDFGMEPAEPHYHFKLISSNSSIKGLGDWFDSDSFDGVQTNYLIALLEGNTENEVLAHYIVNDGYSSWGDGETEIWEAEPKIVWVPKGMSDKTSDVITP